MSEEVISRSGLSSATKPRCSFAGLPIEIITQICSNLCLHCQLDHVVDAPYDQVAAGMADQIALCRLSKCSKLFRDIAQPILFHWYHGMEMDDYHLQLIRLSSFVLPILRQQHLAASVKALSFSEVADPSASYAGLDHREVRNRTLVDPEGLCAKAAEQLGGHLERRKVIFNTRPTVEVLQEIALASSPNLSQVALHRNHAEGSQGYSWVAWEYDMPNLTYLAFPGHPFIEDRNYSPDESTMHLQEAMKMLEHAPNLRTLIAPDCPGDDAIAVFAEYLRGSLPWDVKLPNLKKLSLNGLMAIQVQEIVNHCPVLEDLEFYDHMYYTPRGMLTPELLGPVASTLRRLCYSVIPTTPDSGYWDTDDFNFDTQFLPGSWLYAEFRNWEDCKGKGLDFSSFPGLGELELEQQVLYGDLFFEKDANSELATSPSEFLVRIPKSLRRLRVGCVNYWPVIFRDLRALAEDRAQFPKLKQVEVEVFRTPPEAQCRELVEAFSKAGIDLHVSYVVPVDRSRGLLPPRPGDPELERSLVVYDS
ncbi:hypothetical protein OQA88_8318 [Cercophora sp. LCS_1]